MALPAAGRHWVSRSRGTGACALSLGILWVGVLCSRKDPKLDSLDGLQLLGPAIISRHLGCRRPNEPSMGIGQAVGVVVPRERERERERERDTTRECLARFRHHEVRLLCGRLDAVVGGAAPARRSPMPNRRTETLEFLGFDSVRFLILGEVEFLGP